MDNGIWATWYDLPEDGREKYLDWLHGDYLPGLQAKPGIAGTAHYRSDGGGPDMQKVRDTFPETKDTRDLGTGTQFLMLVGAPEPATLLAPGVMNEQAALSGEARRMLDLREGVRPAIFSVFARTDGPDIDQRPPGDHARAGHPDGQFPGRRSGKPVRCGGLVRPVPPAAYGPDERLYRHTGDGLGRRLGQVFGDV